MSTIWSMCSNMHPYYNNKKKEKRIIQEDEKNMDSLFDIINIGERTYKEITQGTNSLFVK